MKLTSFKTSKIAPDLSILSLTAANEVRSYHESFPMYQKTPLVEMAGTAHAWGVKGIYVKNEAPRYANPYLCSGRCWFTRCFRRRILRFCL